MRRTRKTQAKSKDVVGGRAHIHTHRRQGESVRGDDDEGSTMAHKQTRMTKQHYHK